MSRRWKFGWLGNVSLTAAAILLTLIVSELGLRLAGFRAAQPVTGLQGLVQHDPVLGWRLKAATESPFTSEEFSISVRINQQGLRGKEVSPQKSEKKRRILVLGDSMAWGWGVGDEDVLTARLEALLPMVEVLNAGVPGYSTDQELLWLEREGLKYEPDLVVLVLYFNDVWENNQGTLFFAFPKPYFVLEPDGSLSLRGVLCPAPSWFQVTMVRLASRSRLVYLLLSGLAPFLLAQEPTAVVPRVHASVFAAPFSAHSLTAQVNRPPSENYDSHLCVALIERMKRSAETQGARFLVAAFCSERPYCKDVEDMLTRKGILVVDLYKKAGFRPRRMQYRLDEHWNPAGHEFVARQLHLAIQRHHLLYQNDVK